MSTDFNPHQTDWFTSLSSLFLSCKTARLLVLAGTERLDRELMIGHMQGKFQLEVISGVGHMLHEVRFFDFTTFNHGGMLICANWFVG